MRDLLILYVDADSNIVKELDGELKVLGVRTVLLCISNVEYINDVLSQNIRKCSALLLFLTKNFSDELTENGPIIKTANKKVIFMSFALDQKMIDALRKQIKGIVKTRSRSLSQYAIGVIKEMAKKERKIKLKYSNEIKDLWDSPLYLYQKKEGLTASREIIVDVSWSANPTRPEPAPALETTLRQTFDHMRGNGPFNILDFGAGKLRHTVILLEAGHNVAAVEYPEIFLHPTQTVKSFIERANRYGGRYGKITFPDEFISLENTYDLIILINVTDIIPDPLERLFVLDQCNKKLNKGKYLLWFTQHGDKDQRNVVSDFITDGGCTAKQARKTFYTEFNKDDVDLMLALMGFEREPLRFDSGNNQAWLYKKVGEPIIKIQEITMKMRNVIRRKIHIGGDSDTVVADLLDADSFMSIEDVLSYDLIDIKSGQTSAYKYEKIIEQIIKCIFKENFKVSEVKRQYPLHKGKMRIDIKAEWRDNSTLKTVLDSYNLKSTFVPVECKNYSADIGNPELAQILTRSDQKHRHFGIVTCRTIENDEKISDSLYEFFHAHNFLVIVLDDEDLNTMLKLINDENLNPPWIPRDLSGSQYRSPITEYIKIRIEEVMHHNKRKKSIGIYKQIKAS